MKTVSAGTSAQKRRASLAAGVWRSPACPSLLLVLGLVLESTAVDWWRRGAVAITCEPSAGGGGGRHWRVTETAEATSGLAGGRGGGW